MNKNKKILRKAWLIIFALFFSIMQSGALINVKADTLLKEVYVRVESLEGTIAEGPQQASNGFEALDKLLKEKNIKMEAKDGEWGKYIESIGDLKAGKFGGWDGWMYYVKNGSTIESGQTSIYQYNTKDGDNLVVYYGNFDTPIVNSISFQPEIVKENEGFKMNFSYSTFDYTENKAVVLPIKNAKVSIDKKDYVTDAQGNIEIKQGLFKGEHSYKVSGYNKDSIPTVIMDKGLFTIDNVNKPVLQHSDKKFNDKDNSKIEKNINKELDTTLNFMKNNSSNPWAAISLSKLSIKADEKFIKSWAEQIKKEGIKELSPSELETRIMSLTAMGYTPYNFQGQDLVKELFNRNIEDFYNNEIVFALFSYDYAKVKENYNITEDKLINSLLDSKLVNKNGDKNLVGWTWFGDKIDPDMTGAVINALAPYYNGKQVKGVDNNKLKAAVDEALNTLSYMQNESGDIVGQYGPSCETNAFIILGLTSLGVDPEGSKFTKNKGDLVSALLSYKGDNGQFNHNSEAKNNYLATEQAFRALICLKEYKEKGTYDYYSSTIDISSLKAYKLPEETKKPSNEEKPKQEIEMKQKENLKNQDKKGNLPKTGSPIGFDFMIALSIALMSAGVILNKKSN